MSGTGVHCAKSPPPQKSIKMEKERKEQSYGNNHNIVRNVSMEHLQ